MRGAVVSFIDACLGRTPDRQQVEREALALYRWQRSVNPSYDAFCGVAEPTSLEEIPAVPVALFRSLPLCCFPPEQARHLFHTSGTTSGQPGVHRLLDTTCYDRASAGWFRACLPRAPQAALSLVPSPARAPHSSLSHMLGLLYPNAWWGAGGDGLVDGEAAWATLERQREPVFVASTALALANLLLSPGRCRLPAGSVLMTTGGFKGRSLSVSPKELLAEAVERLGGVAVVGEYGMTELSSQLWTRPWHPGSGAALDPAGPFYGPPWLVPVVVDPGTGAPLGTGELGQLRFVDLANDHSVLAIETMDQGLLLADGGLMLRGRLPGAAARGCSLSVEEALRAARGS
jgi:acyl-CoA synthetase (AMP-forming)/AMP-acid ligase II